MASDVMALVAIWVDELNALPVAEAARAKVVVGETLAAAADGLLVARPPQGRMTPAHEAQFAAFIDRVAQRFSVDDDARAAVVRQLRAAADRLEA